MFADKFSFPFTLKNWIQLLSKPISLHMQDGGCDTLMGIESPTPVI
jgi:hypothetical protein